MQPMSNDHDMLFVGRYRLYFYHQNIGCGPYRLLSQFWVVIDSIPTLEVSIVVVIA